MLCGFSAQTPANGMRWSEQVSVTLDMTDYRKTLGNFMTGVTLVSTFHTDDTPSGVTAKSFTSVSLDAAIILVCICKQGRAHHAFAQSDRFTVNILAADQRDMANLFASQQENRFQTVDWRRSANDARLIHETAAWLDCIVHNRIDAGSHENLMGKVLGFDQSI